MFFLIKNQLFKSLEKRGYFIKNECYSNQWHNFTIIEGKNMLFCTNCTSPGMQIAPSSICACNCTCTFWNIQYYLSKDNHVQFMWKVFFAAILFFKVVSWFCLYLRISLNAEPIWFSFTVKFLIDAGEVSTYFGRGYLHPPKINGP